MASGSERADPSIARLEAGAAAEVNRVPSPKAHNPDNFSAMVPEISARCRPHGSLPAPALGRTPGPPGWLTKIIAHTLPMAESPPPCSTSTPSKPISRCRL